MAPTVLGQSRSESGTHSRSYGLFRFGDKVDAFHLRGKFCDQTAHDRLACLVNVQPVESRQPLAEPL